MGSKFKRAPPQWALPRLQLGIIGKIGISLAVIAILAAAWISSREAAEVANARAYDVAHARKLGMEFLPTYGIQSLKDEGDVDREPDGAVFNGIGLDGAGNAKRVTLHFRSVERDGKVKVGISRIVIDGQQVFQARQH